MEIVMADGYIMVLITVSKPEEGEAIAKKVVEEGLAACCNIISGLRSIYSWEGKLCNEPEALCIFKTRASMFDRLKDRIKEQHSYKVPEIISIDIKNGLAEYLGWIDESTNG